MYTYHSVDPIERSSNSNLKLPTIPQFSDKYWLKSLAVLYNDRLTVDAGCYMDIRETGSLEVEGRQATQNLYTVYMVKG